MSETEYRVGRGYRLKIGERYFRATLVAIHEDERPRRATVIIREHSVDSFNGHSDNRRRHTKHSEVVPIAKVDLDDLFH